MRPFQSPLDMDRSLQDGAVNNHGAFSGSSLRSAFFFSDNVPPHSVVEEKLKGSWCVLAQPCLSCLSVWGGGGGDTEGGEDVLLSSVPFFCKR